MSTTLRSALLCLPLLACATPAAAERPSAPAPKEDARPALTLGETAVGSVAGCSVAVGNITREEFTEGGKKRRGPRASLTIFDCPGGNKETEVRVAEGQRVSIGGQAFVVGTVKETADSQGSVQLLPQRR